MSYGIVSPVSQFACEIINGDLIGFAAPEGGRFPAGVVLTAGGTLVKAARATRFSQAAAVRGIRFGWCGFTLGHVVEGFAISDELVLVCESTNRVLGRFDPTMFSLETLSLSQKKLSIQALLQAVRLSDTAQDVGQILPLAVRARPVMTDGDFADAAFSMILGRQRNRTEESWADHMLSQDMVDGVLNQLVTSNEFRSRLSPIVPGPFHPSYKFDLSFL